MRWKSPDSFGSFRHSLRDQDAGRFPYGLSIHSSRRPSHHSRIAPASVGRLSPPSVAGENHGNGRGWIDRAAGFLFVGLWARPDLANAGLGAARDFGRGNFPFHSIRPVLAASLGLAAAARNPVGAPDCQALPGSRRSLVGSHRASESDGKCGHALSAVAPSGNGGRGDGGEKSQARRSTATAKTPALDLDRAWPRRYFCSGVCPDSARRIERPATLVDAAFQDRALYFHPAGKPADLPCGGVWRGLRDHAALVGGFRAASGEIVWPLWIAVCGGCFAEGRYLSIYFSRSAGCRHPRFSRWGPPPRGAGGACTTPGHGSRCGGRHFSCLSGHP